MAHSMPCKALRTPPNEFSQPTSMVYRDPETPPNKSKLPVAHYDNYDADDEDTADFDSAIFVLPDGTSALEPEQLKSVEDATNLLKELVFQSKNKQKKASTSPVGTSSDSDKENEDPALFGNIPEDENDDDDMIFGDENDGCGQSRQAGRACDRNSESDTDEDAATADTIIGMRAEKRSRAQAKRDNMERKISLDEANTEIWLLKSIIKDQAQEIELLKEVGHEGVEIIRSLKEQLERAKSKSRREKSPFSAKMHGDSKKRKSDCVDVGEKNMMDIDSGRAKRVKHQARGQVQSAAEKMESALFKDFQPSGNPIIDHRIRFAIKERNEKMAGGSTKKSMGGQQGLSTKGGDENIDIFHSVPTGDKVRDGPAYSKFRAECDRLIAERERRLREIEEARVLEHDDSTWFFS
ncbi:hypothetical protein EG329_001374 [Mollisiaceae sp. DMI_Dod_QoI]|nr:hypothetical protein EG329_001374 [Helotiales sp. DMI_Dod_QoI]